MTNAQRQASVLNSRRVVWMGSHVTTALPGVLQPGVPVLRITSPAGIAGTYPVGLAAFGAAITSTPISGTVVQALDAANASGPSTTDGCTAITNAGAVSGNIAIIDRGTCGSPPKVKNAEDAGAIAVIIADTSRVSARRHGSHGRLQSHDLLGPRDAGRRQRHQGEPRCGVSVNVLAPDLSIVAGADVNGHAQVNAPNPLVSGSSISHWDPVAFPNQLMEPNINGDLTHSVQPPQDLTLPQLRDIGWYPDGDLNMVSDEGDDQCLGSDLSGVVTIGGINNGVPQSLLHQRLQHR